MEPIEFVSTDVRDAAREQLREARKDVIKKAKSDYEKAEKKKELAKRKGYDDWMLPSVLDRIDQQSTHKVKSKKSKKEKKKHKKKKKKHVSSSSDSSSESDADECKWMEKTSGAVVTKPGPSLQASAADKYKWVEKTNEAVVTKPGPSLQRDDWMGLGFDTLPTVSRQQLRAKDREKDAEKEKAKKLLEMPGQHPRELNPYWKNGGTGLPEEKKKEEKSKEYAKETDKNFKKVYSVADPRSSKDYQNSSESKQPSWRNRQEPDAHRKNMFKSPSDSPEKELNRLEPPEKFKVPSGYDSFDRHHHGRHPSPSDNIKIDSFRRPKSPESHTSHRTESSSRAESSQSSTNRSNRDRSYRDSDHNWSSSRSSYSRDRNKYSERDRGYDSRTSDHKSRHFLKPGEHDKPETSSKREYSRSDDYVPSWKKKTAQCATKLDDDYVPSWKKKTSQSAKKVDDSEDPEKCQKEENYKRHKGYSSDSSSSCSSLSSDNDKDKEEDMEEEQKEEEEFEEEIPVILTEDQMNDLSAKILRAELMGDEDLMKKLQAKLNASKEARAKNIQNIGKQQTKPEAEEVLLTYIDRNGVAWPVAGREEDDVPRGKKKKKIVRTHGSDGNRQKYFDDDDRFDLKDLVQREKMSTAESQNSMFARLAGRSVERTDDEYQIDDVFVSRAAKEQSEAKTFDLQKARAIFDYKKMSTAMENCKFCFEKVAKHLIVAIGHKVYLSVPDSPSLTEGHCLITPMEHVTSGTAMDEDVWQEVQLFRKSLVKMYMGMDKDSVFMETSMNLKRFPHACIECVPLEMQDGEIAPMYFKKAILESETEWAMNKKLVDLSKKNVRRAIPKGLPYFSVDFGLQGGFAHVIEDERVFPPNFGMEILGGLIDAEPHMFRKKRKENFEIQRQKVLQFARLWEPHDFTRNLDSKNSA